MKIHWARRENSPLQNPYIKVACLNWVKRENTNKIPRNATCTKCVDIWKRHTNIEKYDRAVERLHDKFFKEKK